MDLETQMQVEKLNKELSKRARELAFDALFEILPINFYWMNAQGILLGCNDKVLELLNLTRDEFIGKYSKEIVSPTAWKNSQKVLKSGKGMTEEEVHLNSDGKKTVYFSIKYPIHNRDNEVIGLIGISIDVTEKKNLEEREQKALLQAVTAETKIIAETELRQAIMVLSGSIAHDLRTPISSLKLAVSFLKQYWPCVIEACQKSKSIKQSKQLNSESFVSLIAELPSTFEKIVEQMRGTVDVTLKSLNKSLQGNLNTEDLVICSLDRIIRNALERYPFEPDEQKYVHWNNNKSFEFMGNPILFTRIIFNLLNNALYQLKQNQSGEIFISVKSDKHFNYLSFKDTAGGIAKEILPTLFGAYETTKEQGSGIGLAFCKITMKQFGGDIICHSIENKFTEFVLSFPKINKPNRQKKSTNDIVSID